MSLELSSAPNIPFIFFLLFSSLLLSASASISTEDPTWRTMEEFSGYLTHPPNSPPSFSVDAESLQRQIDELAAFSDVPAPAVTRVLYSEKDVLARRYIKELMEKAGLSVREDAVGNILSRWNGQDTSLNAVATGSHIDAIPFSGKYDGVVGVLGALEAINVLKRSGFQPRRSVEVIMFTSEEPTRFGISCLGSRLMAGSEALANALKETVDVQNISFFDAARSAGYNLNQEDLKNVLLKKGHYSAFVELHIEQGPTLEEEGLPIGIVTAIAAPASIKVEFEGNGGHAGAVLMPARPIGTEVINMAIGEESDAAVISTANGTSNQVNDLYPSSSSVDESCGEAKRNLWGPRLFGKISESKELKESKESNVKECTVTSPVETVCKRQEVLCVENSNQDAQTPKEGLNPVSLEPTNAEESDSPIKSPSNSANVGSVMPHQDGSHPFPHDTGASGGNQISADCAANGNTPAKIKIIQSTDTPKTTKKSPIYPTGKALESDNATPTDEDDACFPGSSNGRSPKTRTTVPTAPAFRCGERAEKRKEFFAKVEQKHQALEAEKMQYEARSKEESEAALKELRKNMVFRATPMPNFYHEGPPPKVELKKPPPTRAKSPKLGRRKSLNDVNRGDSDDAICYRLSRHSFECKRDAGKNGSKP